MTSFLNRRAALLGRVLLIASIAAGGVAEAASLTMFASTVNTWVYTNSLGRTDMTQAAMATSLAPAALSQLPPPNRTVFSPTLAPPYSGWGDINPVIAVYPRYANGQTLAPTP